MNKEQYPERIYCEESSSVRREDGSVRQAGHYVNTPLLREGWDQIEYVRADLVPQWHDAKQELPPLKKYGYSDSVLIRDTMGDIGVGWFDGDDWCSKEDDMTLFEIVAWCPIPKYNNK